jgi:glutamine synthetase
VFTYGVGNRSASVRIPTSTASSKIGYIEDRRPASDIDPYVACAIMTDTILLDESKFKPLENHFKVFQEFKKVTHFDM